MNSLATLPQPIEARTADSPRANPTRYFYSAAGLLLLALVLLGFQQFYLHGHNTRGQELPPAVKSLLVAHGVAMTLWVLLFAVQPLLVAWGNRRAHIALGSLGAGLAACIVPLGLWTTIAMTKSAPDSLRYGLNRAQFMAPQFAAMLTFGTFALIGILKRHHPEHHRPMMFLATLSIVGAATSRIGLLRALIHGSMGERVFGPSLSVLVIGALVLVTKTILTRSWDRWLAGGLIALAIVDVLAMRIAPTATWEGIANLMIGKNG